MGTPWKTGRVGKPKRWMTLEERRMILALKDVEMGLHPKRRFVADMVDEAERPAGAWITEAQAYAVRSLVVRYRRQLPAEIVALAGDLGAKAAPIGGEPAHGAER